MVQFSFLAASAAENKQLSKEKGYLRADKKKTDSTKNAFVKNPQFLLNQYELCENESQISFIMIG